MSTPMNVNLSVHRAARMRPDHCDVHRYSGGTTTITMEFLPVEWGGGGSDINVFLDENADLQGMADQFEKIAERLRGLAEGS